MLTPQVDTLPTGLTVIRIPMPAVRSVTVLAFANTGSRYEKEDQQGIAHFFEHMVFKGTGNYPTAQDLAQAVDAVGANFNAFTSKEYTGYYVKAASEHFSLALDVVSDMLLTPQLRQEDIDREKGVIIEELNMYVDSPARHISDLFDNLVFAGSGLGHNIIGTKETIRQMNSQHFHDFLHDWYGLGNLVLTIAGDEEVVNSATTLAQIESAFAKGEVTERTAGKIKLAKWITQPAISDQRLHVEFRQTEQAHFVLGWPGIDRRHPDRFALALLDTILGGNMSSRLFTEVREKRGLCYYVRSDRDLLHNTGIFGASAGVDPTRVEEALKVTIDQFTQIATGANSVNSQELQQAKDYTAGKMALGLEDSESVAQFFGMKQLLMDNIETPEENLAKLQAVTLDEVNAVAKKLIKSGQLRLALIGPFSDQENFAKIIKN